jgi:hypothetical protein
MRGLLEQMRAGIKDVDPRAIREAASRARKLGAMLDESQGEKVGKAVEAARKAASIIVRRIEKEGATADVVLRELDGKAIDAARFAFLDLEDGPGIAVPGLPSVDVQRVAGLEV